MKILKSMLLSTLVYIGICVLITIFWRLLEVAEFGHIQISGSDSIIGALFAYSILKNLRLDGGNMDE